MEVIFFFFINLLIVLLLIFLLVFSIVIISGSFLAIASRGYACKGKLLGAIETEELKVDLEGEKYLSYSYNLVFEYRLLNGDSKLGLLNEWLPKYRNFSTFQNHNLKVFTYENHDDIFIIETETGRLKLGFFLLFLFLLSFTFWVFYFFPNVPIVSVFFSTLLFVISSLFLLVSFFWNRINTDDQEAPKFKLVDTNKIIPMENLKLEREYL